MNTLEKLMGEIHLNTKQTAITYSIFLNKTLLEMKDGLLKEELK